VIERNKEKGFSLIWLTSVAVAPRGEDRYLSFFLRSKIPGFGKNRNACCIMRLHRIRPSLEGPFAAFATAKNGQIIGREETFARVKFWPANQSTFHPSDNTGHSQLCLVGT
jgi:hypothetical protein